MTIFNLLAFYGGWFACVMGAARGWTWLGPVVVALLLAVHLGLISSNRRRDTWLILGCIALGFVLDSTLSTLGFYTFITNPPGNNLAPPWMVALWANFATTLHLSMGWLQGRYWLAALLGAVGGPISYVAGERLGAVELHGLTALVILAVAWGLVVPGLVWASQDRGDVSAGRPGTPDPKE